MRMRNHEPACAIVLGTAASLAALAVTGCATGRTGTHVELNREEISQIKKVGLCVQVQRGFAVRLQYISNADESFLESLLGFGLAGGAGASGAPSAAAGAIGGGIGAGVGVVVAVAGEFSPDKRNTRALKPEAAPINSADAIGCALLDKFRADEVFPAIELTPSPSPAAAREGGTDALLVFTVRRWGLRPPLGAKYASGDSALAELELDVNLKLVSCATGKVLWERDEFYVDSESHSLHDFKTQASLLSGRMRRALGLFCEWTAAEVQVAH